MKQLYLLLIVLVLLQLTHVIALNAAGKTHYDVLGLSKKCTSKQIRQKYRQLAKQYHPDKLNADSASQEKFIEITKAYEVLNDEVSREDYDEILRINGKYDESIFKGFFSGFGKPKDDGNYFPDIEEEEDPYYQQQQNQQQQHANQRYSNNNNNDDERYKYQSGPNSGGGSSGQQQQYYRNSGPEDEYNNAYGDPEQPDNMYADVNQLRNLLFYVGLEVVKSLLPYILITILILYFVFCPKNRVTPTKSFKYNPLKTPIKVKETKTSYSTTTTINNYNHTTVANTPIATVEVEAIPTTIPTPTIPPIVEVKPTGMKKSFSYFDLCDSDLMAMDMIHNVPSTKSNDKLKEMTNSVKKVTSKEKIDLSVKSGITDNTQATVVSSNTDNKDNKAAAASKTVTTTVKKASSASNSTNNLMQTTESKASFEEAFSKPIKKSSVTLDSLNTNTTSSTTATASTSTSKNSTNKTATTTATPTATAIPTRSATSKDRTKSDTTTTNTKPTSTTTVTSKTVTTTTTVTSTSINDPHITVKLAPIPTVAPTLIKIKDNVNILFKRYIITIVSFNPKVSRILEQLKIEFKNQPLVFAEFVEPGLQSPMVSITENTFDVEDDHLHSYTTTSSTASGISSSRHSARTSADTGGGRKRASTLDVPSAPTYLKQTSAKVVQDNANNFVFSSPKSLPPKDSKLENDLNNDINSTNSGSSKGTADSTVNESLATKVLKRIPSISNLIKRTTSKSSLTDEMNTTSSSTKDSTTITATTTNNNEDEIFTRMKNYLSKHMGTSTSTTSNNTNTTTSTKSSITKLVRHDLVAIAKSGEKYCGLSYDRIITHPSVPTYATASTNTSTTAAATSPIQNTSSSYHVSHAIVNDDTDNEEYDRNKEKILTWLQKILNGSDFEWYATEKKDMIGNLGYPIDYIKSTTMNL